MDNVIRPTFGRRSEASPAPVAPRAEAEYRPHRVYGTAAGYLVALIRADTGPEGEALRIVVGPEAGNTLETVGIVPATVEGEASAEQIGLAILRTLEIVAEDSGSAP